MKVADFFTSGMASPSTLAEDASAEVLPSHSSYHTVKSSKASKVGTSKRKSSSATAVATPPPSSSIMTINIRVEKPDIILVEDMEDLDTNAIVLNVCI
jgi:vacuolar protein sorting-associated protein 13A/C